MPDKAPHILLLGGPTASGKTAYALKWAEATGGVILNADSMQLYRDAPTLTARPSPDEAAMAPHLLYGVLDPTEVWSTGDWIRAATPHIESALKDGPPLCVVGGTGLYFLSLVRGLAEVPAIDEAVRDKARATFDEIGDEGVRALLRELDPQAAARIAANDRQRLSRALEVVWQTGRALSDWQKLNVPILPENSYRFEILSPDRDILYARCDARLEAMVKSGALEEVKDLIARGFTPDWAIGRVLGLTELAAYLKGEIALPDALALAQQKTRNYAKRQMTFFRNQFTT